MQNRWWSEVRESYYAGVNYSEGRWWYPIYCAIYAMLGLGHVRPLLCKLLGHEWTDDSVCTPDSAYMGVECKRCGMTHGRTLY